VCVCVCVCVSVCVYAYTALWQPHSDLSGHVWVCDCVYACMCTLCVCVHTCVCVHVCVHVCVCVCVRALTSAGFCTCSTGTIDHFVDCSLYFGLG